MAVVAPTLCSADCAWLGEALKTIEVEGRLNPQRAAEVLRPVVDILVVGSAIFQRGDSGARVADSIRLASRTERAAEVREQF